MKKAPISLQDLRRSLYVKAKAEPAWRFWGLYVHVCKMETLHEAYRMAKSNNGAPGMDGVTFEAIEESGEEGFLRQIRDELVTHTYRPVLRRFSLAVSPRFLWECLSSQTVSWSPAPASSNPAGGFPALGFPVCFVS